MKQATIDRRYSEKKTDGFLTLPDGSALSTLERPDLDNQVGISCIPEGTYIVRRDTTGKHQWYTIQDVTNRTFIEIHEGSKVEHSNGCILMSKKDLQELYAWFGDDSWLLTIQEFDPIKFNSKGF